MAEKSTLSPTSQTSSPLPRRRPSQRVQYLEVNCTSSGKTRRFAESTDAGSAVELINMRLKTEEVGLPSALYIEAVKDGEEPIVFGPTSTLVSYGDGWKLQTVTQTDLFRTEIRHRDVRRMPKQAFGLGVLYPERRESKPRVSKPINLLYIFKIVFAFIFIFVLGAIFTLFLDYLPELILFVK
ncbi:uncharacterized protein [Arachis hypogaea]|uniref:uncharacterized protein isoform X2 n=1 Tax=Arachis hypogaea TaxID=3818 RepID=UPI000DECB9ED|nr:uncharacterized protein LOC112716818 isoform X3 [Arachis hypogaea]